MGEPRRFTRRRQQVEALCAASVRALAGDPALLMRGSTLYRGLQPLPARAPHLRLGAAQAGLLAWRGVGDAQALRLRHSDTALFRRLAPSDPVERLVFELLEQLRVETLPPATLPGVSANVRRRFEAWSLSFHESGWIDTQLGMLLYTVAQMAWSRLHARPVTAQTEDLIEATRAAIAPMLGEALAGLRRHRRDQRRFAVHALEIARVLGNTVRATIDPDDPREAPNVEGMFALLLDFDDEAPVSAPRAPTGVSRVFGESGEVYRVFTSRFDTESNAVDDIRPALLREYRAALDDYVARQGHSRFRLMRLLSEALLRPREEGRLDGQEEGRIDGRRLARLVTAPGERGLFVRERFLPSAACAVTFLLDCSGSMKDQVHTVAPLIDILARALDRLGIVTEVLGFTTGAWNGGRAYRAWLSAGRPAVPGRLNEVAYRVFMQAGQTWRQARPGIAALFKADLFREGIDGEAVQWGAARLLAREEPRRLLVVISDGCPADSATQLANDTFYLDNHLKQVVQQLERAGQIEVMGVGVGLDLSPYYRRNLALEPMEGLTNEALYEVARFLGGGR